MKDPGSLTDFGVNFHPVIMMMMITIRKVVLACHDLYPELCDIHNRRYDGVGFRLQYMSLSMKGLVFAKCM